MHSKSDLPPLPMPPPTASAFLLAAEGWPRCLPAFSCKQRDSRGAEGKSARNPDSNHPATAKGRSQRSSCRHAVPGLLLTANAVAGRAGAQRKAAAGKAGPMRLGTRGGGNAFHSPCRYSGRALCCFYVSYGLPLSAGLQGAEGWRGSLFLPGKKRDSPERTHAGAVTALGGIYGMDCCW